MVKFGTTILALLAGLAAADAHAQTAPAPAAGQLLVAADSSSGTYKETLAQVAQFCQAPGFSI